MSSTSFGYLIIYVKDVDATLRFFTGAFGLERKLLTPEGDYGELMTGSTTLAFGNRELARSNFKEDLQWPERAEKAQAYEIALVTDDVHATCLKAIEEGATKVTEPVLKPWGQTVGYLRDPNGILLEICSPVN